MIGPTALCPEGIELILLDLDDTIVIDGAKVSPRVVDAIALARERGCMACISSGRPIALVPELLRKPATMDYHICTNGSTIYDTLGGVMHEELISRDDALALMDAIAPLRPGWNGFVDGEAYFEWRGFTYMASGRTPSIGELKAVPGGLHTGMGVFVRKAYRFGKRMITKRDGRHQVRSLRPTVEAAEQGMQKIGCSFSNQAACDRAVDAIEHLGRFQVARMGRQELEITAAGVTKATAARWLMDYLKIDPQRVVAFGDSQNDAPLAEVCGTFVAMDNATDKVKALADDVCESVYDDGVARWLERAMAEADGARHV